MQIDQGVAMKRSAARRRMTSAGIFTASMADVVFLLLVFFILTYTVSPDLTQLELPRTRVRTEVPEGSAIISIAPPAEREQIRVSTGEEPALPIGSDEEIVSFASTLVAGDPQQPFVIRADRGVQYERIDTVLDALKQANAREVYLLSEQETVE
jgi:biopolymer transport protein ExbD